MLDGKEGYVLAEDMNDIVSSLYYEKPVEEEPISIIPEEEETIVKVYPLDSKLDIVFAFFQTGFP